MRSCKLSKMGKIVFEKENLPEGWVQLPLSEIGDVITGSTPSKKNQSFYGNEIAFFKPTDLDAGYYVKEAREYLSAQGKK